MKNLTEQGVGTDDTKLNPYAPSNSLCAPVATDPPVRNHGGPSLDCAVAGLIAAIASIPLLAVSINDDPNPIGYLLILSSFPIGGLVYRLRSRKWPIDPTVRQRQRRACLATLLLPITIAMMTGMRAQGLQMTILGGIVSVVVMSAILIAGQRRRREMA